MGFLNFGKKKEELKTSCSCASQTDMSAIKNARFIVLGACCQKSAETFSNVKQAVLELGLSDQVVNIGDPTLIAQYGVMQTPAFVVDSKVVSYGRLLHVEDAKKLIENTQIPSPDQNGDDYEKA